MEKEKRRSRYDKLKAVEAILVLMSMASSLSFVTCSGGDVSLFALTRMMIISIAAATLIGRLLSVILGIYGIVVVSLITSIIINFYNETKDINTDSPKTPLPFLGETDTPDTQANEPEKAVTDETKGDGPNEEEPAY